MDEAVGRRSLRRGPPPRHVGAATLATGPDSVTIPATIPPMSIPRRIARRTRLHHRVYVVELDPAVRRDRRFVSQNRYTTPSMTCLYVGSTGVDPAVRFGNHLRGHKGCPLVRRHGVRLRPDLYADFPPMTWQDAVATEVAWARELREAGYAVYQH